VRALLAILIIASIGLAQTTSDVSFVNEGVINAPIQEVWKVFSTSEGYKALGPALAEVDLRIGGTFDRDTAPTARWVMQKRIEKHDSCL
jgi:uncharacterized protein YndB with AHSA1/START domain